MIYRRDQDKDREQWIIVYQSTRCQQYSNTAATLQGLATDYGLFTPLLSSKGRLTSQIERCFIRLMSAFWWSTAEVLDYCINAYDKFDSLSYCTISEIRGQYNLNPFHGSTIALSDGLCLFCHTLRRLLQNMVWEQDCYLDKDICDTGKLLWRGLTCSGTEIIVLSKAVVLRHKSCKWPLNATILMLSLDGNFDDVQTNVKLQR